MMLSRPQMKSYEISLLLEGPNKDQITKIANLHCVYPKVEMLFASSLYDDMGLLNV